MKEIAAALFKFQQEVGKVTKDATAKGTAFSYRYATLSNVLEVIREPLAKANLVVVQSPDNGDLFTQIIHVESGEFVESHYQLTPVKNDPQSVGSAITYARRYALVSMLCLDVDDDDDGNAATKPTPSEQQAFREQVQGAQKPKISPAKIITEGPARQEQIKLIYFYLGKLNRLDAKILIDYSVSELKDLTSEQAVEVINNLEKE